MGNMTGNKQETNIVPLWLHPHLCASSVHTVRVETDSIEKDSKVWTEETKEQMRDCFDTKDWDTLCSPHRENSLRITNCITNYINFCVENIILAHTMLLQQQSLCDLKSESFSNRKESGLYFRKQEWAAKSAKGTKNNQKQMQGWLYEKAGAGLKWMSGHNPGRFSYWASGDQTWAQELICCLADTTL